MVTRTPCTATISRGFTLIELLVVMAIVATLLSLVAPRFTAAVDRAREATLKADLQVMRDAIDKFHSDRGQLPETLEALVAHRYIREVPVDPITDSRETWVIVEHPAGVPGVWDVRSGAPGTAGDRSAFGTW